MQVLPQSAISESAVFQSSLSPKGQITLPKQPRDLLRLRPKEKVVIQYKDGAVSVTPLKDTLESIYQSVPALKKPLTDREMTDIAWEDHAAEVAQEGL